MRRPTESKPGQATLECSYCETRGYIMNPKRKTCPDCNGKGFVRVEENERKSPKL